MRIKLTTTSPLTKQNCWFALSEAQERSTVHQLRKKIAHDLELIVEPSNIKLSIDGFNLLPQTIIKDLVRDGDLITVKADTSSITPIEKKRKISSVEEKRDIETTQPTSSSKKSKSTDTTPSSSTESKDAKEKSDKKKDKKKDKSSKDKKVKSTRDTAEETVPKKSEKDAKEKTKKAKKQKSKKDSESKSSEEVTSVESEEKKKRTKKSQNSTSSEEEEQPPAKKQRSNPFEGLAKTQKRNMRRRLLNKNYKSDTASTTTSTTAMLIDDKDDTPTITTTTEELHVENLTISNVEPLNLIKKNKNKKKNHLKQLDQRSHVHYTASEEQDVTMTDVATATTTNNSKNPYGRAFVTFIESEHNYKGRNNKSKYPPTEYPIHRVPTLFYADQGLHPDEMAYQPPAEEATVEKEVNPILEETPVTQPDEQMEEETAAEKTELEQKAIDYEKDYPEANFTDNIPFIGSKLAIKTLELTANYTPEISDWKQVILKALDGSQVTFEFLPGFGKATTKGGKFDNKRHRKRHYDDENDWYEDPEEQAIEEEEEEEEEELEATFEITDIFAIRNMS